MLDTDALDHVESISLPTSPLIFSQVYRETIALLRTADLSADQLVEHQADLEEDLQSADDDNDRIICCLKWQLTIPTIHGW